MYGGEIENDRIKNMNHLINKRNGIISNYWHADAFLLKNMKNK